MAVQMYQGNMPHIFWIDLANDGMFTECAVMKRDGLGNVFFFPLTQLDRIDRGRLAKILTNRNAQAFELWDLMSQITLNNGINALEYFHQMVEMISPAGKRTKPREGVVGTGIVDTRSAEQRAVHERDVAAAAQAAATAAANAAAQAVRGADQPQQAAPATATQPEEEIPPAPKKRGRQTKAAQPAAE